MADFAQRLGDSPCLVCTEGQIRAFNGYGRIGSMPDFDYEGRGFSCTECPTYYFMCPECSEPVDFDEDITDDTRIVFCYYLGWDFRDNESNTSGIHYSPKFTPYANLICLGIPSIISEGRQNYWYCQSCDENYVTTDI